MKGKYLKTKLKKLGYEMKDVAKRLHISPQALNNKLSADDLKLSFVQQLARSINKSVYSLIEDQDPDPIPAPKDYTSPCIKVSKMIPLIPPDALTNFEHTDQIMDNDTEGYIIPEFSELNVEFLIRMTGNSMQPMYNSGDILGCRRLPADTFLQWNRVYLMDTIQGPLVKHVHQSDKPGYIICVSDNESYQPFEINYDTDVHAIAIVLGVIRLE